MSVLTLRAASKTHYFLTGSKCNNNFFIVVNTQDFRLANVKTLDRYSSVLPTAQMYITF